MKHLRRLLWFVTVRLFAVCLISALLVITFYLSMNITNIIVLLTDGMAARAQIVLGVSDDQARLEKFFSKEWLEKDVAVVGALTHTGEYEDYDVRGMDHRLSVQWIWTWPWSDTASARAEESVPAIDGKVKSSRRQDVIEQRGEEGQYPPEWNAALYHVELVRKDGRWIIGELRRAD